MIDFLDELNFTISVCDKNGTIIYLNEQGAETFKDDGGMELLGSDILDCHPEPSKSQLREMFSTHETNWLIKGKGQKRRLIYQTPVYKKQAYAGYYEMIVPIPE